jgi:hypothetical protein
MRPIHPYPALLLEADQRYVVISDLHIGFESELNSRGINISSESYVNEMLSDLSSIIRKAEPDAVVLLGDLKSSIHTITRAEWNAIPNFLQRLSTMAKVFLVPGNHDGNISHLVPSNVRVNSGKGMLLDDTLLVHGHALPARTGDSINRVVMGHLHPVFLKEGSAISGQRVWVYLKVEKRTLFRNSEGMIDLIVMPTFNKYFYYSTQSAQYKRSVSPILRKVMTNVHDAILSTLDGAIVGNESMLEQII